MSITNSNHRSGETIAGVWQVARPADNAPHVRRLGFLTLELLWNLFDLTREGRPVGWYEQFSYA